MQLLTRSTKCDPKWQQPTEKSYINLSVWKRCCKTGISLRRSYYKQYPPLAFTKKNLECNLKWKFFKYKEQIPNIFFKYDKTTAPFFEAISGRGKVMKNKLWVKISTAATFMILYIQRCVLRTRLIQDGTNGLSSAIMNTMRERGQYQPTWCIVPLAYLSSRIRFQQIYLIIFLS